MANKGDGGKKSAIFGHTYYLSDPKRELKGRDDTAQVQETLEQRPPSMLDT